MVINRNEGMIKNNDVSAWRTPSKTYGRRLSIAFDTETTDGLCTLIADSQKRHTDYLEFKNLEGLLKWLSNPVYKNHNLWFFNLQYDVNAVIKWLSIEDRRRLVVEGILIYGNYKITMIENKEFTVSRLQNNSITEDKPHGKPRHTNKFYDIMQYLPHGGLAKLSENTPVPKMKFDIGVGLDMSRYETDDKYHNAMINYCIRDCEATEYLGIEVINRFYSLGIFPIRWHSKASVAKEYVLRNLKMPKLPLPKKGNRVRQDALMSVRGAMIGCEAIGVFKNTVSYDLNSCYPKFIADLPLYSGNNAYNTRYEPDSDYSFYHVNIDFEHEHSSMLWYPQVNPKTLNKITDHWHPTGKMDVWLCKPEADYFYDRGYLTDADIISASHIMPGKETVLPFHDMVYDLYNRRLEAKKNGDIIEQQYKIILNSIYGLMLNSWGDPKYYTFEQIRKLYNMASEEFVKQYGVKYGAKPVMDTVNQRDVIKVEREQPGSMYAPYMASHILASARVKLFTDFEKDINKGRVLAYATDAVFLTKTSSKVPISNKLGDWSETKIIKMLQYGTGRRIIFDKYDHAIEKTSMNRNLSHTSEDILKAFEKFKMDRYVPMSRDRVIKLKASLKAKDQTRDLFNTFQPHTIDIKFKTDKRHWYDRYDKIGDIWDYPIFSRPFTVDELKN